MKSVVIRINFKRNKRSSYGPDIFSYVITLRSLSKKFINGCRISIVSVTPKKDGAILEKRWHIALIVYSKQVR